MAEKENFTSLKILVAESQPETAQLILQILGEAGHYTAVTQTGEETLKFLTENELDLLLLWQKLPDMDAMEVMEAIIQKNISVPVVTLTAHGEEHLATESIKAGAEDYVVMDQDSSYLKTLPKVVSRIHERYSLHKLCEENEKHRHALFHFNPNAVFSLSRNGEFLSANPATETLIGHTRKELFQACRFTSMLPEKEVPKFEEFFKKTMKGEPQNFETYLVDKEGNRKELGMSMVPIIVGANIHGIYGIADDITERKSAEAGLYASKEKAEEATNLKDKFISLVSHDLRSPLSTMLGFLQLIRSDMVAASITEKTKKMLDSTIASGQNMLQLIEELLSVSRLKTGKIKPHFQFMDAYFFAIKAMADLSPMADKKGVRLINHIPEKTRLYVDSTLFNEVIYNLASNAIKFCSEGDQVTFSLPEGKPTTIAVTDTGKGIEPERQETLFCYEVKTSTKGTTGEVGTGLGLPLSLDIMEAHGGSLRVESKPNQGSTFLAEVPLVRPTILLVDDSTVIQKTLQEMLKGEDAHLEKAGNGQEALEIIQSKLPHLILLDLFMPVMDGFELLQTLKNDPQTNKIPIIVLTAAGNIENREKAFKLGADDLVTKPTTEDELLPRIRKHILSG